MRVRRIDDLDAFSRLAGPWEALAREAGAGSPFLSHDWFACCWRAPRGRRPEVLLVEDGAGPVALVPLALSEERIRGLRARVLRMLTAPDTPFVDWIVAGPAAPALDAVLGYLRGRRDWDVLLLDALPVESRVLKALEDGTSGGLRWHGLGRTPRPVVDVTGGWEAYWNRTSQRFKKTFRSVRNRLERAGTLTIEEHRALDAPRLAEIMDVSRRSWKASRDLAMANMQEMPDFFRELSERAARRGWLRAWILRLDGRAVATEYQLEAEGRVHGLRADIDADLPADLSPGSYLNGHIVRALFERDGVHEYDMGPGDSEYKSRWATGRHETARHRAFGRRPWGALLGAIETGAVPMLRRVRAGVTA